ncbi:TPM domain-containing protein [Haloferula sp. BvORR071]|uniref:TPM domain-containing protein n=1 Tax=Haloferula sp. BvORR071 TaxID=1396141 RepID=UPI002240F929|nr:TPM domain-containing protein [Haloferula sp. BvORR071]
MRCPYCRNPLAETAVECLHCHLTLDRATAILGAVPRLGQGIFDSCRVLSKKEVQKIVKSGSKLTWQFPQTQLHVLLHEFPREHPFALHVFWVFNCGGFSTESHRGPDNHAILLALDPVQGKSALTVGYGLEPFLSDEAMDHLLELSEPAWKNGEWSRGILDVIAGLERLLESAALEVAAGFGLSAEANNARGKEF